MALLLFKYQLQSLSDITRCHSLHILVTMAKDHNLFSHYYHGFLSSPRSQHHALHQMFHTTCMQSMTLKLKQDIDDCYSLLGVEENCGNLELKDAYLQKAKDFHPDAGSPLADGYKFHQIKEAYRTVLEYRKGGKLEADEEKEAEIIFDIKHTAPQHRQYLEFEGVGYGTPSQRQRQYQQYRVARVTENVFQHRTQRLAAQTESEVVFKNKQQAKKVIISNAIERLVEDLIQESMKRGEFDNLSGQGRPLEYSPHNPFIDLTTHNINKILANSGFAPEWIMLSSEIRKELKWARHHIAQIFKHVGAQPHSASETKQWQTAMNKFKNDIFEINTKIHKFNLIVPFMENQLMPYSVERELKRIQDNIGEYLLSGDETSESQTTAGIPSNYAAPEPYTPDIQLNISWKQVWIDIKSLFLKTDDKKYDNQKDGTT